MIDSADLSPDPDSGDGERDPSGVGRGRLDTRDGWGVGPEGWGGERSATNPGGMRGSVPAEPYSIAGYFNSPVQGPISRGLIDPSRPYDLTRSLIEGMPVLAPDYPAWGPRAQAQFERAGMNALFGQAPFGSGIVLGLALDRWGGRPSVAARAADIARGVNTQGTVAGTDLAGLGGPGGRGGLDVAPASSTEGEGNLAEAPIRAPTRVDHLADLRRFYTEMLRDPESLWTYLYGSRPAPWRAPVVT